ncbi:MAG: sigma-54-dependent Fis family transcriptional regulator [Candidatus Aminicenantes bacterium]|nr:sigma-54-dependent Fis family transcriptional regulator [Candidatus Aminicenantes bacterium]
MEKILIVEDEKNFLEVLEFYFKEKGFDVDTAATGEEALEKVKNADVIVSDIKLPGEIDGIEILEKVKEEYPEIPVILITAYASVKDAVRALKIGAEDYIIKPFDLEKLEIVVKKALEANSLRREVEALRRELESIYEEKRFVTKSPGMKKVVDVVKRVAPQDVNVLIIGESGTGKSLLARIIHDLSPRKRRSFVSLNCAAIPESLLESELFGYEKGAFTGAYSRKRGIFELAQGGTIFLDEISSMSPMMQVKLLNAIQERRIRRIGGETEIEVDVRIITATNKNIEELVNRGEFREDLFYRLDVVRIEIPPLRERKEDIPLLAQHFADIYSEKFGKKIVGIDKKAMKLLENYNWPGNVRELENVIERAVALEDGEYITVNSLPSKIVEWEYKEIEKGFSLEKYIDDEIKKYLKTAYLKAGGDKKKAAELLGISYRSFRYYWKKYNL